MRFTWRIFTCALLVVLAQFSYRAAAASRDIAREAQIEKQLAEVHPEVRQAFQAATAALDKKDYPEAERLLREIVTKAPDYDVALRRLGSSLVVQGKRAEALEYCERAVKLNRSSENLSTMAYALIEGQSAQQNPEVYQRALQILLECRTKANGTDLDLLALTAQVALELNRLGDFMTATDLLGRKYPNDIATHYFGAIAAALRENWVRAETEIKKAEALGMDHEAVRKFLGSGVHSNAIRSRLIWDAVLAFGLWVGGLGALFGSGFLLSKLTLRQARPSTGTASVTSWERVIRKIYRAVLNLAGVYYYISLPVVLVLVVAIVAAVLYLFIMIGRIPIKLMLLLVIGAFITIIALVKSLFIRVNASDPGRALEPAEAQGLWQLTQEVAESVGTRPIDEIRITPGTDLAVYERGTWRQKLRNEARRILILGTGVLTGFKQNDFRCVLAHEYGHFSNRDTAGGDIALRVQNDMLKFYFAMREAGQATFMNVAFHFLRIYNFIFRRISHGATRLQEILADRVAAQMYGAPAFQNGLTHVIRRSLEFEAAANEEIKQSIETRRPLRNLYELPAPGGDEVATELEKALNRPTSQDDTHPGPQDRFRLIAQFQQASCTPREGEVWELFNNPEAIRREMVETVEKNLAPHREQTNSPAAVSS